MANFGFYLIDRPIHGWTSFPTSFALPHELSGAWPFRNTSKIYGAIYLTISRNENHTSCCNKAMLWDTQSQEITTSRRYKIGHEKAITEPKATGVNFNGQSTNDKAGNYHMEASDCEKTRSDLGGLTKLYGAKCRFWAMIKANFCYWKSVFAQRETSRQKSDLYRAIDVLLFAALTHGQRRMRGRAIPNSDFQPYSIKEPSRDDCSPRPRNYASLLPVHQRALITLM